MMQREQQEEETRASPSIFEKKSIDGGKSGSILWGIILIPILKYIWRSSHTTFMCYLNTEKGILDRLRYLPSQK